MHNMGVVMELTVNSTFGRRTFLVGTAATGILALSGCESLGGFSMTEAIKRLLTMSSKNAFAKLTAPGGFWDSEVARFDLPVLFTGGGAVQTLLSSGPFKQGLQKQLNLVAEKGAERAAPVVYDAVKKLSIKDAVGIVKGGPTAATSFLRAEMGSALINSMIPGLSDALSVTSDPIMRQAMSALVGVDVGQVAQAVALRADNSIWYQIGAEESAIRANPSSTNDPLLIGVLKVL
jgi:hypothetical protein